MMMFWVMGFVILTAIVVTGGLFYFMRKESGKASSGEAVPIVDISELKNMMPEAPKAQSNNPIRDEQSQDELIQAKDKLAELERQTYDLSPDHLKPDHPAQVGQPSSTGEWKYNSQYNETESSGSDRIKELESQITLISQKSIEQAQEAVKVIEALMKENDQLKTNQSAASSMPQDAQTVASIVEVKEKNALLENQLDLSNAKVSQLEGQLAVIKKELGQQLIEANAAVARLKAESEAQERVSGDAMLKEKEQLEEVRQASMKQLRQMEDDLMKAKEENLLLKDSKKLLEAKLSVIEDDFKGELERAKELIVQLSTQRDEKVQLAANLDKDVTKLKELNGTLIDKAKILQYELNRYRAQSSGLERVCENFKTQVEEMFGQVEQAKKEKNRLLQERINLESGVASLKSENVRLIERDKVYQQELEKTKEQINRFEKLYKNFKNDVGDVSQD